MSSMSNNIVITNDELSIIVAQDGYKNKNGL